MPKIRYLCMRTFSCLVPCIKEITNFDLKKGACPLRTVICSNYILEQIDSTALLLL